jgi:4a-hydroxytetrahydrobiopterin dehydratase
MSRARLLALHCRPLDAAAALDRGALCVQLAELPQWREDGDAISRNYSFADFHETMAFVNALAFMVHREDHHPDLEVSYDRCTVRFSTHSAKGVTENDLICAAKADAIFDQRYGAA